MNLQTTVILFDGIGETDCEAITEGFLAQPINALSSTAYIVAGLWLVRRAARAGAAHTITLTVFGLAVVGVGIGSIAFHGPMPPGARLVHDLTIAAVFVLILADGVCSLRRWPQATFIAGIGGTTAVLGAVMAFLPRTGPALTGLVGAAAFGTEAYIYRTGRRGPRSPRAARQLAGVLALLIVAGLVQLLSRTGAPLCDPDSVYQGHAMWHLLTATAFGVYGIVAFSDSEPRYSASRTP